MGAIWVRQPNGKLAGYSTTSESFFGINYSEESEEELDIDERNIEPVQEFFRLLHNVWKFQHRTGDTNGGIDWRTIMGEIATT